MFDHTTSKLLWVGIAVGVVAIIGAGAFYLFPHTLYGAQPLIQERIAALNKEGHQYPQDPPHS